MRIILDRREEIPEYDLFIEENQKAVIERAAAPRVMFQIQESNLVSAIWDYFHMVVIPPRDDRSHVIRELKRLITELT